jgi:hypothetical protein
MRGVFRTILDAQVDIEVVGEARDGEEAVASRLVKPLDRSASVQDFANLASEPLGSKRLGQERVVGCGLR